MIQNIRDVKLVVQPIYMTMHHDYVFEGPCRFGTPEQLTSEYDNMVNAEKYIRQSEETIRRLGDKVQLKEPIRIDRNEEFLVSEEMIETMLKDSEDVDLFLLGELSRMSDLALALAERTTKPMMSLPSTRATHTITSAALLSRGYEFYAFRDWDDTLQMLEVLRVRKILSRLRILCAPRYGTARTISCMDNFIDLETVTRVLGTQFRFVNPHELIDQTHIGETETNPTIPGRRGLNPGPEEVEAMNRLTDELIAGADECDMTREDVFQSVRAHLSIYRLLDYYGCNAFAAPCPDLCATRRLNNERFTFCLNHSLLGEMGIPSACEYDLSAVVAMAILSGFLQAPAYMGNTNQNPHLWHLTGQLKSSGPLGLDTEMESKRKILADDPDNTIFCYHSVPKRNFRGFDSPLAHYAIRPFTSSGFGATLRYDFNQDAGTTVTLCRIDPSCRKIFVAKGTICGGRGYGAPSCTLGVFIKVKDGKDFFDKQIQFGNHIPLAYGDCFEQIVQLGRMIGLEVITA